MNEISIHGSYIFGSKHSLEIEENTEETEEPGSKEGQTVGLIKDQTGKANSW